MNTQASPISGGANACAESQSSVQSFASPTNQQANAATSGPLFRNDDFDDEILNLPEYCDQTELSVLGCILLDAKYCFPILDREGVGLTHWRDLRYQRMYSLLEKMHRAGEEINPMTFVLRGRETGIFTTPEETVFASGLCDCVPSACMLETVLPTLKDLHQRRLVFDTARRLREVARKKSTRARDLLLDAEEAVKTLRRFACPEKFTVRNAGELTREELPNDDNILADRLLARGQSMTLLGAGGLGKSRLLLQLAACVIAGKPFLDLRTHAPGSRWLVFQAENSTRRLQTDLNALRRWLGEDAWERVYPGLFIHTLETSGDSFMQLDSAATRNRLADVIAEYNPDVVCFDPLNCFAAGDLNRDGDMRDICMALTQVCLADNPKRAIVVLHHALTGRAGASRATGFDRASFGRNSKLLHAWTRGQINLAPAARDNNRELVLSCGKCSNGEEFEPYGIRLNPDTMIYEVNPEFKRDTWEKELEGGKIEPVEQVLEICGDGKSRADAVQALIQLGYSRTSAYRHVQAAINDQLLVEKDHLLQPAE